MPREIQSSEFATVVFLSYFVDLLVIKDEGCHFVWLHPKKLANDNGNLEPFEDVSLIKVGRLCISQIGSLPIWCKHKKSLTPPPR